MWDGSLFRFCGKQGTFAHDLFEYKTSLVQDRYTWRHDKVLLTLAGVLEQGRGKNINSEPNHLKSSHLLGNV